MSSSENLLQITQYGEITIEEWLAREKARIEKTPGRKAKIVARYSRIALFVNPVASEL
jgi:hypothetical protein